MQKNGTIELNTERLLLISGANANYELTISEDYIMSIDPANKLAISIHYYAPYEFTKENNNSKKTWEIILTMMK